MPNAEFDQHLYSEVMLLERYQGRFVVITCGNIAGEYNALYEAFYDAVKKYEIGTFTIQNVNI